MPECLYVKTDQQEDGTGRQFDYIWGQLETNFRADNCHILNPPPMDMPKIFGCDDLLFENGSIVGVRDGQGSHVEGIHINGCRRVTFRDWLFDDNDIFHVFITQWGEDPNGTPFPHPSDITFERCRFGLIGPGGGYYSVKVRDDGQGNYTNCPNIQFIDCQRKGPTMDCPGVDLSDILVVSPNADWPPFRTQGGGTDPIEPPDPVEPPVEDDLEQRVAALEAQTAALTAAAVHIDSRVDVIEADMTTLG